MPMHIRPSNTTALRRSADVSRSQIFRGVDAFIAFIASLRLLRWLRRLRLWRLFGLFRSFGLGGLVEHHARFDVQGKGLS